MPDIGYYETPGTENPYSLSVQHTEYILIARQGKVKEIYIKTRRKIPQRRGNLRIFAPGSPLTEIFRHDKISLAKPSAPFERNVGAVINRPHIKNIPYSPHTPGILQIVPPGDR